MLKEVYEHLDCIFGIKKVDEDGTQVDTKQIQVVEEKPLTQPDTDVNTLQLRKSLEGNVTNLDVMYEKINSVLETQVEVSVEFMKSRDAEAVAKLGATLVAIARESRETKQVIFAAPKSEAQPQIIGNQTNNTIQVGSMRELNDLLKEMKSRQT